MLRVAGCTCDGDMSRAGAGPASRGARLAYKMDECGRFAGDQHGPVLPCFEIEIGGAPDDPHATIAVAEAIVATEVAERLAAEWPPGQIVVTCRDDGARS